MPGLGGGWAAGELVREGKGAALGGRGRGTLCLSPSQMAATPTPANAGQDIPRSRC